MELCDEKMDTDNQHLQNVSQNFMKHIFAFISMFLVTICFGQKQKILGTYSNGTSFKIVFNEDSTFTYTSRNHPIFFSVENFSEQGSWTILGDTIVLNPKLEDKPFIETHFQETKVENDTLIYLTFNHVKRYFGDKGNTLKTDTLQIKSIDYAFNKLRKKNLKRITNHPTVRCGFIYVPSEIITSNRTIAILKPIEKLESIFIGCYELQGTKEFKINKPTSNHLTLNVYSNYYQDGLLRKKKLLIKSKRVLYSRQKPNGKFDKGNWHPETILKKEKSGS
jgi:hypothetical protein